jgi:uncharacterized protein
MLQLDLGRLERNHKVRVDEAVPPDDPMWAGSGLTLSRPLDVHLEAQQAGPDVVVRGEIEGEAELSCRRCLRDVRVEIDEDIAALFRSGVGPAEAEEEEVYPLPPRGRDLDLRDLVREQVLLAVPQYAVCSEACRGLCPRCGANLNEGECACGVSEVDDRWGPLRKLKLD